MSRQIDHAAMVGVLAAALTLSLGAGVAAAAPRLHHRTAVAHHHYRAPLYASDRRWPPSYGYVAPSEVPIAMPGYVYLPGHGIVGSPCDMPDSACTNEYRNVR